MNTPSSPIPKKDLTAIFANYQHKPSKSLKERSIRYLLRTMAYMTIAVTLAIVFLLLSDAQEFFSRVSLWHFLTETRWEPFGEPKYLGVLPLLMGTLMVAVGSCLFALPLGLGTAIYLTQFAHPRFRAIAEPLVEILGGIPTVVYGYFALTVVTPLLKTIFPSIETFNALSASIVVGIGILPMVSSISADAIGLVPAGIKNAAHALGMRKFHVVVKVIIPAAYSGIICSFILAFARAIGETMAVTLAAGATPNLNFDYLQGIQTITAFMVQVSLGDTPAGSIEYYTLYALGLTLFVITFLFNYLATVIIHRYREVYQ